MEHQHGREFKFANEHYGDDFFGKFAADVAFMPMGATMSEVETLLRYRMDTDLKDRLLYDKDKIAPPMRVVGYEIYKDTRESETFDRYDIIPRSEWGEPVFPNTGSINESTGLAPVIYNPVAEGNVGIIIYFQYLPATNF